MEDIKKGILMQLLNQNLLNYRYISKEEYDKMEMEISSKYINKVELAQASGL